ncbi:MAG: hypothetical protein NVS4B11_36670 [Ktedonobacteraceae bacterium]
MDRKQATQKGVVSISIEENRVLMRRAYEVLNPQQLLNAEVFCKEGMNNVI